MKKFQFTLERMQDFKNQLLDKEKDTLGRLRREQNELELRLEDLQRKKNVLSQKLMDEQAKGTTAVKVMEYNLQIENCRMQVKALQLELKEAIFKVEEQTKVVVAASQEVSGLEKLEEKQREEYRLEERKANENDVLEYVTTRLTHQAM